ncbi:MAG: hypothetical protein WDZ47_01195 [Bacteroidales bacterium]
MNYYNLDKNHRISIKESTSLGLWGSHIDIDDLDELRKELREMKVSRFSLKYYSMLDDIPNWHEAGISLEDLNEDHFNWLTSKIYGDSKYLEIDTKTKLQEICITIEHYRIHFQN